MPRSGRPSFASPEPQLDLFGAKPAAAYRPDPDKVRARLHRILCEARAATTLPWDSGRLSLYRIIFPQLTLWLPDEEGTLLRLAFEQELARLQSA